MSEVLASALSTIASTRLRFVCNTRLRTAPSKPVFASTRLRFVCNYFAKSSKTDFDLELQPDYGSSVTCWWPVSRLACVRASTRLRFVCNAEDVDLLLGSLQASTRLRFVCNGRTRPMRYLHALMASTRLRFVCNSRTTHCNATIGDDVSWIASTLLRFVCNNL